MKTKWLKITVLRNLLAQELRLLRQYRDLYLRASGFVIPLEYAQAAMTRIVTDESGTVVIGAYCYNDGRAAFRYLGFAPAIAEAALAEKGLTVNELSEITGIVFGEAMSRSQRQLLYIRIGFDLVFSNKAVVIGGSVIPGIRRVQKQLMRHTLFTAPVPLTGPDGQTHLHELEVYYAWRHEVLPLLAKALLTDLVKQIRPRRVPTYGIQR